MAFLKRVIAGLAGAVIAAACAFDPAITDGAFACGPGGACPEELTCASDGRCRRIDQGTGPDGGTDPQLTIEAVPVLEAGTEAVIKLRLDRPSARTVVVAYSTADGSAVAPADYQMLTGVLEITPGVMEASLRVAIAADNLDEDTEDFFLNLSASGARLANPQAKITIEDDDPIPAISIDDLASSEGSGGGGNTNFDFVVKLSAPSTKTVTVSATTVAVSATAGTDFTASTGTVQFNPGAVTATFRVRVDKDTDIEPDETFEVHLSMPTNATMADDKALGTIQNDD